MNIFHIIPGHLQFGKQRLRCPKSKTVDLWHARGLPSVHCPCNQHFLLVHRVANFIRCSIFAQAPEQKLWWVIYALLYIHCSIAVRLGVQLILLFWQRTVDGKNYWTFEYDLEAPGYGVSAFATVAIGNGRKLLKHRLISNTSSLKKKGDEPLFFYQVGTTRWSWPRTNAGGAGSGTGSKSSRTLSRSPTWPRDRQRSR